MSKTMTEEMVKALWYTIVEGRAIAYKGTPLTLKNFRALAKMGYLFETSFHGGQLRGFIPRAEVCANLV